MAINTLPADAYPVVSAGFLRYRNAGDFTSRKCQLVSFTRRNQSFKRIITNVSPSRRAYYIYEFSQVILNIINFIVYSSYGKCRRKSKRNYRPYCGRGKWKRYGAIKKAYLFAEHAHKDQKRLSGEPYFIHPSKQQKFWPNSVWISRPSSPGSCMTHWKIPKHWGRYKKRVWRRHFIFNQRSDKTRALKYRGHERHVESLRKFSWRWHMTCGWLSLSLLTGYTICVLWNSCRN